MNHLTIELFNHSTQFNHFTIHHSYLCELCLHCGFLIVIRIKSVKIREIRGYFLCKTNPICQKSQMNVTSFNTGKYVKLDTWSDETNKPNQTQFKPNSKPICKMQKMNISSFVTGNYEENPPGRLPQNKPNQTQFRTQSDACSYRIVGRRISLRASFSEPSNREPNFKVRPGIFSCGCGSVCRGCSRHLFPLLLLHFPVRLL